MSKRRARAEGRRIRQDDAGARPDLTAEDALFLAHMGGERAEEPLPDSAALEPQTDPGPKAGSVAPSLDLRAPPGDRDGLSADELLFLRAVAGLREVPPEVSSVDPEETKGGPPPTTLSTLLRGGATPQPDVTVDLHGLDRASAKRRLRGLLSEARRRGSRLALVITGRGLHSQAEGAVLRREAPVWLREWEGTLVAEQATAPRALGGPGALLVRLKPQ